MKHQKTLQQENFIRDNNEKLSVSEMANILKTSKSTIYNHIWNMGMKRPIEKRIRKVSEKNFIELVTKESAYLLGLIWTDGHVAKKAKIINIECIKDDLDIITHIFKSTGEWKIYERKRNSESRMMKSFTTYHPILHKFLTDMDYQEKSIKSPCKILKHIPEQFHKFFWRGFLDGDGSIYINSLKKYQQISFSGSYNQDWTALEKLLTSMKIPFRVKRILNKIGDSSYLRIIQTDGCKRLLNFIYNSYEVDKIGFPRKYEKAKIVMSKGLGRYSMPKINKIRKKDLKTLSKNWCK